MCLCVCVCVCVRACVRACVWEESVDISAIKSWSSRLSSLKLVSPATSIRIYNAHNENDHLSVFVSCARLRERRAVSQLPCGKDEAIVDEMLDCQRECVDTPSRRCIGLMAQFAAFTAKNYLHLAGVCRS